MRNVAAAVVFLMSALAAGCNPVDDPGGFTVMITVIVIIVTLLSFLPFFFFFKRARAKSKLLMEGLKANATIVMVNTTGVTINNQPQLAFTLEIQPPGNRPAYRTECRQVVSPLDMVLVQPGNQVAVRVDKADHAKVVLDFAATRAAMGAGGGMGMQQPGMAPMGMQQPGQPPMGMQQPGQAAWPGQAAQPPAQGTPFVQCAACQSQYPAQLPQCPQCGTPRPG